MRSKDADLLASMKIALDQLLSTVIENQFFEPNDLKIIEQRLSPILEAAESRSKGLLFKIGIVNKSLKTSIFDFLDTWDSFPQKISEHNRNLATIKSTQLHETINPVEGRDLDSQQLMSIAMDVDSRLVIAGAGTGKTTTIIGLVKDLLSNKNVDPGNILLLSFTNASASELKERVFSETSQRIDVSTFHRLGLKIIASVEGKVPKISNLDINQFASESINRLIKNPKYLKYLMEYIAYEHGYVKDDDSFESVSEYQRFIQENPLYSLKKEKVKSFGEADIANFLYINGIDYKYEDSYIVDTRDENHGQYNPDFHIIGTNIYIEYFGIDRQGNVANFIVPQNDYKNPKIEYNESMQWKRELHENNNTKLIELFSFNRSEGNLLEILEDHLIKYGVKFNPLSPEEVVKDTVENEKKLQSIASMMSTAICLIKGNGGSWDDSYPKPNSRKDRKSLRRVERILRPVYDDYQSALKENNEIDFEDMLNVATRCIRDGYPHPYRYVIVDEYQDISKSRFELLKTMRDSNHFKLFCVGDDWQSIYRFNGSNISYILDFEKYWGPSEICKIETTYRFSGEILDTSSNFVMKNPKQYRKTLIEKGYSDSKIIPILGKNATQTFHRLTSIIQHIPDTESILILGRYKHDIVILGDYGFTWKPDIGSNSFTVYMNDQYERKMKFMTVHGSKGLQADHVIILNNKRGPNGFPGHKNESLLISYLLGGDNSSYEEERRLFYVALTRARKMAYLPAVKGNESSFFMELFDFNYSGGYGPKLTCPKCGGTMLLRKGKYGSFYGCSNYMTNGCRYTMKPK